MTATPDPELAALLRERSEDICSRWTQRLLAEGGNHARGLTPPTELLAEQRALLAAWAQQLETAGDLFESDPSHPLAAALERAGAVRVARGYSPAESLAFLQSCREPLLEQVHACAALQGRLLESSLRLQRLLDRCVTVLATTFVAAREDIIRRQTEALREVSTPVITLWDSILLLPLVGVVDSLRAQQISEQLLQAIAQSEAAVTIIDVTGVPVMDTSVARHILKTVAAADMLGTRVVLTGISPSTAQTMVKLGIDLSGVPTRGSLKAGVALALSLTGRQIGPG